MRLRMTLMTIALGAIPVLAVAQSSTNYRISDQVFNNGGGPNGAAVPTSPGFKITLDSIGDGVRSTQCE